MQVFWSVLWAGGSSQRFGGVLLLSTEVTVW